MRDDLELLILLACVIKCDQTRVKSVSDQMRMSQQPREAQDKQAGYTICSASVPTPRISHRVCLTDLPDTVPSPAACWEKPHTTLLSAKGRSQQHGSLALEQPPAEAHAAMLENQTFLPMGIFLDLLSESKYSPQIPPVANGQKASEASC